MKHKSALIGAGILSAIAVGIIVLWVSTEKSRAESQAILLQAKAVYAPGHATELSQYVAFVNEINYAIPQIALLAGIILLGISVLRMSFALSRRIEGRIIHRGEHNEINGQLYIAPPETKVGQHLSDRGATVLEFDPRFLRHNREVVDAGGDAVEGSVIPRKTTRPILPKQRSGRSSGTTRRK